MTLQKTTQHYITNGFMYYSDGVFSALLCPGMLNGLPIPTDKEANAIELLQFFRKLQ